MRALTLLLLSLLPVGPALAERGTFEAPDGLEIAHWSEGTGETALVFVHCWACDHEFWREQWAVFAKTHRVVAMDLPGHGASETSREAWSIAGLGADVAALVESLELDRVILIGHSLGGPVSLEAAARLGGRVIGVIVLDTLHDAEQKMPKEQTDAMLGMFRADWTAAMRRVVGMMYPAGADSSLVAWTAAKGSAGDPDALLGIVAGFEGYDFARAMSAVKVPLRAVNAAERPPFGPATAVETNRKYVDFDAEIIEGVGHYLQLEAPERVNSAIARFVAELEARTGAD